MNESNRFSSFNQQIGQFFSNVFSVCARSIRDHSKRIVDVQLNSFEMSVSMLSRSLAHCRWAEYWTPIQFEHFDWRIRANNIFSANIGSCRRRSDGRHIAHPQ